VQLLTPPHAEVLQQHRHELTEHRYAYATGGEDTRYDPQCQQLPLGASCLPPLSQPAEDRNRTSPFPYGGHRFEFRAVGSSQVCKPPGEVKRTITVVNTQ
jgi:glutamine synthetase